MISLLVSGAALFLLDLLVFGISGSLVYAQGLTAGVFVASLGYATTYMEPLQEILYCINMAHSTAAVRQELEQLGEIVVGDSNVGLTDWNVIKGQDIIVQFENKSLKYNFEFVCGKKYLIQGESGIGKSTLLKLIQNKIPYIGEMLIDGRMASLSNEDFFYLSQAQRVFAEDYQTNVEMYGAYPICRHLYEGEVELLELCKSLDCTALSGGEQQVVKYERALNTKKPLLLLDEPFAHLDQQRTDILLRYLENYQGTVIMVTHGEFALSDGWERSAVRIVNDVVQE